MRRSIEPGTFLFNAIPVHVLTLLSILQNKTAFVIVLQ